MKIWNLLMMLMVAQCVLAVHINEVMFNPEGTDNNLEFVEIFLDNNQSLDGWTLGDADSNDTLIQFYFTDSSYALIVEEGYVYENSDASYYSAGATIGNNLNNDLDEIFLYNAAGILIDSMSYDGSIANNNGMSIELYNYSWYESIIYGGTPGFENSIIGYLNYPETDMTNASDVNASTNQTNSSILPEEDGPAYNETDIPSNQTNSTDTADDNETFQTEQTDSCDININITSSKLIYEEGEKVSYRIDLDDKSYPYVIEYWVEDLQQNIVKSRYNTTNTNQRSWTPDCDDGDVFILKARIAEVDCNDTSIDDDSAQMPMIVKCPEATVSDETFTEQIEIEEIYLGTDSHAKFGEMIKVKLHISKGDTAKTAIEMYAEGDDGKVSETTGLNMDSKNNEISVTVPLAISPNCDEKLDDGTYTLVVSGLGVDDEKEFEISGMRSGSCKIKEKVVTEKCKVKDCECSAKEIISPKKPRIKSFYTLTKKFSERIRLFANVECPGDCILDLSNETQVIEKRKISNFSGRIDFNVTTERDYLLEISDVFDKMNMSLELDFPKDVLDFKNATLDPVTDNNPKGTEDISEMTSMAIKETEAVYEGTGEKTKKRIKYFLMGVLGVLAVIIIFKKGF